MAHTQHDTDEYTCFGPGLWGTSAAPDCCTRVPEITLRSLILFSLYSPGESWNDSFASSWAIAVLAILQGQLGTAIPIGVLPQISQSTLHASQKTPSVTGTDPYILYSVWATFNLDQFFKWLWLIRRKYAIFAWYFNDKPVVERT